MSPLFQITEKDIATLSKEEFADLMNRLLKAEAAKYGIPVDEVKATLRIDEPDGGVDARVNATAIVPPTYWIPAGLSVWQYKSGKISTQDIRGIPENKSRKKSVSQPKKKTQYRGDEARKPGVQAAVKRGGQYRLVVGHDYGITERENREAALGEVFGVRKWEKVAKLILTSEIASWASDYLSIALQPYFRRTIKDGFLEFDGWKRLNDLRVAYLEYLPDSHRATVTENIGQLIKTRSGSLHIRITGRAGVGKNTFGFRNDSSAFTGI